MNGRDESVTIPESSKRSVSLFVPAYNEEKYLSNTVEMCLEALKLCSIQTFEIIIVNDGSRDKTGDIINELAVRYPFVVPLHNDKNRGFGNAFKRALEVAQYDRFFVVTGDNELDVPLLKELMTNMYKADLILVYFLNREIRGRKRNLLSTLFNTIYMITYSIFVQYVNGGAIYNTEKLKKVQLISNRFSIIMEASIKSLLSGCSYYEVSGYMQRGLEGSTSLSFKNLVEVVLTYLRLFYTIKIRREFSSTPRRIR